MFLITSAAYITADLSAEYGKIPPTFLPLQNKRLFRHQLELASTIDKQIVLSLPEKFIPSEEDIHFICEQGVEVVYVPEELSLGESIAFVLNRIKKFREPLHILHGDTLFFSLPEDYDLYVVGKASDNYAWAVSTEMDKENLVYAGFFSFMQQDILLQSLKVTHFNFAKAFLLYKEKIHIKEVLIDSWFDFGLSNTYYRSKAYLTTQRVFNNLTIDSFKVTKYSSDKTKILGEANWFLQLPTSFKCYLPALWDYGTKEECAFYQIEYFHLSTLAELYVFGQNQYFIWEGIIHACDRFLSDCYSHKAPENGRLSKKENLLYTKKTIGRLAEFSKFNTIDLNKEWIFNGGKMPSINEIIRETSHCISSSSKNSHTIIHGDFCFSNILYNFKTQSIKVIDPRGIDFEGNQTIYGDIRYDIAKLAHSVIGLYDFIIAGYFHYAENTKYDITFSIPTNETIRKVQHLFKKSRFIDVDLEEAHTYPIMIHLFLSMLPLHSDDPLRQKAMLANAFRLYAEYKQLKS